MGGPLAPKSTLFRLASSSLKILQLGLTLAVVLSLSVANGVWAQPETSTPKTVEVKYEVFAGDKTPEEARRQALKRAQAEAVRQAIGTQVQAERSSATIETGDEMVNRFSQVVRTGASGRVVAHEVLSEERFERNGSLFYRVRIKAEVEPATGRSDPGFELSLTLTDSDRTFVARNPLESSDEIIAELKVTKEAYVTLFSVTPDTLQVIWPNPISETTVLQAGQTVQFPSPEMRNRGLHLRAHLPEDRNRATERLVAVATKQNVPFHDIPDFAVKEGALSTVQASLQAFNRWLVDIPLDQRTTATVTYDVVRPSDQ